MKLFTILGKNFKLLIRKKTSLFTILFGPLIIIMILAIAFSSNNNLTISLGYVNPDSSAMTLEFIETLNENYLTKEYISKDNCIKELEQGIIHACINFPKEFSVENNKTNNIIFIVDNSRISLVYSVLESISEKIDIKSEELSKDLTDKLIQTLDYTDEGIEKNIALLVKIKSNIEDNKEDITKIETSLANINTESEDVEITGIVNEVNSLKSKTTSAYNSISSDVDTCLDYVDDLKSVANVSSLENELEDLQSYINTTKTRDTTSFENLVNTISTIEDKIENIEDKLNSIETSKQTQIQSLNNLKTKLSSINTDLSTLKTSLEDMQFRIRNIEVTTSENIVNPITTTVETISSDENRLGMIFPYALMLIIMFISLLLASTLVVVEKQSNASFRTFTTPTRDEYFLVTTFLTAFIIIAIQLAIILGVVSYFSPNLILTNIYVNVSLLVLGIALFVMLGMSIGYIFSTQQATNMTTITLSTIFLFLSNIVFPLETISPILSEIAKYNPFVITSEVLRKSILFNITFEVIFIELSILLGYSVLFFILIIIFQKLSKINYLKKIPKVKSKINKLSIESIILIDEKITNKKDLIRKLNEISDEDYIAFVRNNKKQFNEFLTNNVSKKIGNVKKLKREKLIEKIQKEEEKIKTRMNKNKENQILLSDDEDENKEETTNENNKDEDN